MDTGKAAQRWAEVWERGWREHDANAIAALYADEAFWQQHPFREPEAGYLNRVFDEEESAQCKFETPIVDGDRAAVSWNAQTTLVDGGTEDLVGVSLLRFDSDGLVIEHRDIWVGR
ncbi:MAG: nuclear transport factor 2 family protein [Actinobacteria bacterium]|nr:nuclear transport factor 2 family protein [Actinomycetota bacterium]